MMQELNIKPGMDDADEMKARFKIVCRRCGSEDIAVNVSEGWAGSEVTGAEAGKVQIGCNHCRQNDFYMSV